MEIVNANCGRNATEVSKGGMTRACTQEVHRKSTTRYRHTGNSSARCCVFLLTDILHAPILRIQIRGNVEAPGGPSRGLLGPCDKTHETGPGFKRKKQSAKL